MAQEVNYRISSLKIKLDPGVTKVEVLVTVMGTLNGVLSPSGISLEELRQEVENVRKVFEIPAGV